MPERLIIFDMNGTLTTTPFVDHQPLSILPGREEKIQELREQGYILAIATNQGGVAFGYQTELQAHREVAGIAEKLGIPHYEVACGHPKPKIGFEEYGTPQQLAKRKPSPGMMIELMQRTMVMPEHTLMVGDREEDQRAAVYAGIRFQWASDFFASPVEIFPKIYQLLVKASSSLPNISLVLNTKGQAQIAWLGEERNFDWQPLPEVIESLEGVVATHETITHE